MACLGWTFECIAPIFRITFESSNLSFGNCVMSLVLKLFWMPNTDDNWPQLRMRSLHSSSHIISVITAGRLVVNEKKNKNTKRLKIAKSLNCFRFYQFKGNEMSGFGLEPRLNLFKRCLLFVRWSTPNWCGLFSPDNDETDNSDRSVVKLSCDGERNIRHDSGVNAADKGRCTLLMLLYFIYLVFVDLVNFMIKRIWHSANRSESFWLDCDWRMFFVFGKLIFVFFVFRRSLIIRIIFVCSNIKWCAPVRFSLFWLKQNETKKNHIMNHQWFHSDGKK